MSEIRHIIGIDISTQTITAILIGAREENGAPVELVISSAWTESRPCRDEIGRKSPAVWVELVRECIAGLKKKAREAEMAEAVGVSTTFPGCFAVLHDRAIDPRFGSLYDNTDDAGICSGGLDEALGRAESETINRMWPGNMAIGLAHLVRSEGLRLDDAAAVVPPNTAFAHELLRLAGFIPDPGDLMTDFTQATISGLYDLRSGEPVPPGVADLLAKAMPGFDADLLRSLLPKPAPSWRNTIPAESLPAVRELLGLPKLASVSIGAGDSPLGTLALLSGSNTVINVRGSSDSPMIVVDSPRPRTGPRETVLHYPLPTATGLTDSPWCVVAPMLRSGRVWDWVRNLRFSEGDGDADAQLEALALEAARRGSSSKPIFETALGGERAPLWDASATGSITGLVESHNIGDIALAALEGMSKALAACIRLMEDRYQVSPENMLLVGGPAKNRLWNWITQAHTRKKTFATTFSDASLLGAALLGYGALYDGREHDSAIAARLLSVSRLSSSHQLIAPVPVTPPAQNMDNMLGTAGPVESSNELS
jgi:sugar (pentulose or hexulose) kinase